MDAALTWRQLIAQGGSQADVMREYMKRDAQ